MRSLSKELGPEGIRVNAVCPGWVETEAAMKSLAWMSQKTKMAEPELLDEIVGSQSLSGLMQPSDVSQLYLYLASSLSSNITGQAINIDRGEVLG
jgi:3-hydroxybutyrate dehydrogenase